MKSYLSACRMFQIHPFELESQMIIRMNHLMRQRVLEMSAIAHLVRAEHDSIFGRETTSLARCATSAADVGRVEVSV